MALTNLLDDPNGNPVRQFIEANFPNIGPIRQNLKDNLQKTSTIRPTSRVPYAYIGRAIDYRIRYYFGISCPDDLWAYKAVKLLSGGNVPRKLALEFFEQLSNLVDEIKPPQKRLTDQYEMELNRYCFVLGLFEEVARLGDVDRAKGHSPLFTQKRSNVDHLLQIPESHWIEDINQLSRLFYDNLGAMTTKRYILNPSFEGTPDVMGADADLIVENCLIDIKTTTNPMNKVKRDLYQLIGYVLLDYNDSYRMDEVGIYWARQGVLTNWNLSDFLKTLSHVQETNVQELRSKMKETAQGFLFDIDPDLAMAIINRK